MVKSTYRLPSNRQLRVGELVRHRIAEELARGSFYEGSLNDLSVTVTEVRMSPDLRKATAFVLPLAGKNSDTILKALHAFAPQLQGKIGRSLGLKFTPELSFETDTIFDQVAKIDTLLNQAKKKDSNK